MDKCWCVLTGLHVLYYTCIYSLSLSLSLSPQAGGIGCGVYTTNNAEACHFIADNCSANVIFCENKAQLTKILEVSY